jgi:hypothetical protein
MEGAVRIGIERGRAARADAPRSSHGAWTPAPERPSPVEVLKQQAATRVPELVPIRHARMAASPFAFYRGAAALMAADLAGSPVSGITVQCCGDAHIANFGGFESPERSMVFDVNDFDETLPGPWEWDVKRLAASIVVASRDRGFDDAMACATVKESVTRYRTSMREFAQQGDLAVWYAHLDFRDIEVRWGDQVSKANLRRLGHQIDKAESRDSVRALDKLTERVDGALRFRNNPPLLERLDDLLPAGETDAIDRLRGWFTTYRQTLQPDRRHLLSGYRLVDFARKVVGVGSVGTRCWVAFLLGRDDDDPLFLQIKEAEESVLEPHLGRSTLANHGQRVVEGQRLMQAASDTFLGWDAGAGLDGLRRDFYFRQLWDGKISADLTTVEPSWFGVYCQMCAWTLARAHARSGDRMAIAGYLGNADVFDRAMVDFSLAYGDQNARDYEAMRRAVRDGELMTT